MSQIIHKHSEQIIWRPLATDVSQVIWISDASYVITAVRQVHGVASVSGALNIEKLTGTTASGSGTALLTSTLDLSLVANTVRSGSLTSNAADKSLVTGDRIGAVLSGTLTGLVGCVLAISLQRI